MPSRSFCIHAHFYQPSREDPLTGQIPVEHGSDPYANWNEKVNERCYKPNANAGNFEKISFNIGPTLTRWMDTYSRETLQKIAYGDQVNLARHGVGNAMAQPYHHTIMPLATRRDKELQVSWGIADFIHVYGHPPRGMWLPETAVDLETLAVLADSGIQFTILAPWQAQSPRLDVTHPYRVTLPAGKEIIVFFFHDAISANISFNPESTINGEDFIASHLRYRYTDDQDELILAASDGELYGHHQPFRDKFLNYIMTGALLHDGILTSFPSLWLKTHPVAETIQIRENTSWSCMHGISRWADACGCTPNGEWKRGLRDFLDQTAMEVDHLFETHAGKWLKDCWKARTDYIHVMLGEEEYRQWESTNTTKRFIAADSVPLQRLMRAQWERQRMFTSCGWFFEEFDRIEPRNNLKYAAHAVALSESATGAHLADELLPLLKPIVPKIKNTSAEVYFSTLVDQFRTT